MTRTPSLQTQMGVPHLAGQLRGALTGLQAHVQQQLQGLGGQDSRMAELLRQLGEQEAEQQACRLQGWWPLCGWGRVEEQAALVACLAHACELLWWH